MQTTNIQESETSAQNLEIKREFNAPVSQLFAAFKTSESLKQWWWPEGMYADHIEWDFIECGKYFINMKGMEDAGGGGMVGQFQEIVENERIVMTDQFSDEDGNAISAEEARMPGNWPEVIYITFNFDEADENSSRLHVLQTGIPDEVMKDCIQGWSESFDKLEKFLTKH